jgi:hypothetical protein
MLVVDGIRHEMGGAAVGQYGDVNVEVAFGEPSFCGRVDRENDVVGPAVVEQFADRYRAEPG